MNSLGIMPMATCFVSDDVVRELWVNFCDSVSLARFSSCSKICRDTAGLVARLALDERPGRKLGTGQNSIAAIAHAELVDYVGAPSRQGLAVSAHALVRYGKGCCVYSCGRGRNGQRGVCSVADGIHTLDRISSDGFMREPVVTVAAGSNFSLFLVGAGSVYGCGDGTSGVLGSACRPCSSCTHPRVIPELQRTRVRSISCGADHVLLVCNSDLALVAMGRNDDGQLGTGDRSKRDKPSPVLVVGDHVPLRDVVSIAAGVNHSLCATSDGALYSWGAAKRGQLGHPDGHAKVNADLVRTGSVALQSIRRVAAGNALSLALDAEGAVHSCGDARSGALGYGVSTAKRTSTAKLFRRIRALDHLRVRAISAGYAHAACVTEDGSLYTWGGMYAGHASALGLGEFFPGCDTPTFVALDNAAIDVAAGGTPEPHTSTTLVMLADGSVISAGGSRYIPGHDGLFAEILYASAAQAEEQLAVAETSSGIPPSTYCLAGVF